MRGVAHVGPLPVLFARVHHAGGERLGLLAQQWGTKDSYRNGLYDFTPCSAFETPPGCDGKDMLVGPSDIVSGCDDPRCVGIQMIQVSSSTPVVQNSARKRVNFILSDSVIHVFWTEDCRNILSL